MSIKPETKIVDAIQSYVEFRGGNVLKVHGSSVQRLGEPDLIGGIPAPESYNKRVGRTVNVPFAIEVKLPGEEARVLQLYRIAKWAKVGFCTGVVHSVGEFEDLIEKHLQKLEVING